MDLKVIAGRLHHMHGQAGALSQDVQLTRLQVRGDEPHRTLTDLEHELIEVSRRLADYADRILAIEL
jgi:hypothetical protein